ncbi:hypothetical protein [Streptomyces mirabilis]|uniref:hypothetical protein n=1 Tax=Streptomyces mirabilis TaxID=68239 RepID=UPI0036C80EA1
MQVSTRMRAASTALAILAASLTFAAVGTGTAQAGSCASVLGPSQAITVNSQTIGSFYLAWNYCNSSNELRTPRSTSGTPTTSTAIGTAARST